jgi:elongation factor 1-gamma
MKLFTDVGNFRAFKILIAAEYNGIDIEIPDFELGKFVLKMKY